MHGDKNGHIWSSKVFILKYAANIAYCHLQIMLTPGRGMGNSVRKHGKKVSSRFITQAKLENLVIFLSMLFCERLHSQSLYGNSIQ